ncbi:MAG: ATP-binding protein [Candidatus Bathyarchaeota archaeon]|nr:ATP-binding protein [Candidatus Bathyarchaeota archaeon]
MNLYALLCLCASAVSITLGLSVYYLNRKSTVNKLFMLLMIFNAYWAFGTFMTSQSPTLAGAVFWSKTLFLWHFLISIMLHFSLAFTESDLLKNKFVYGVIYFPAVFFSLIDLTTNWISATPTINPWGYAQATSMDSVMARVAGVWAAAVGLMVLFLFASYYTRIMDKTKRHQTKLVAIGFAIPVVVSTVTDSIFPVLGIAFPVIGNVLASITSIFVVFAMIKYDLFSFRTEIAAENVFSTMPDSVILVNLKGQIIKINNSLVELTGYSEKEWLGKTITDMIQKTGTANKGSTTAQIMQLLQKNRELKNHEITFSTKTGESKTGMISCSIVTNNNGRDVGAAFVLHDITRRKEMEQKLVRSERFASIGELASLLGHDLRNPLSGIRNATYYLKKKHSDHLDDKDLAMFESIDKSIDYSDKIVNDLLDYSCEIKLKLIKATPKMLVRDSLALLQPPENITILDDTSEVPVFKVDPANVSKAFMKIIQNAFDAMPNGGKLHITSEVKGERVLFKFQDNGPGMTKDMLTKLWTPLCTTKAKGMGFGLPISKRLIEAHGGKISVESSIGQGTSVFVELPLGLGAN